jgi:glucose-6-phosphate isomerase
VLRAAGMAGGYRQKKWREAERVRVDVNALLGHALEGGILEEDIAGLVPRLTEVHASLERQRRGGALAFAELPYAKAELAQTLALAEEVRGEFDDLVVLGIGGSALGTRALYQALRPADHAWRSRSEGEMRVHVADTVDPSTFAGLLAGLDPRRTLFNVISKSGDTPETMSQFLIVRDMLLRELGAIEYTRHVVVTTDPATGTLRQIVNDEGFRSLAFPSGVGGRFSVLSAVSLFPAACAGIDVAEVLAGAADMDARCREPDPWRNPALFHAGTLHLSERKGRGVVVLMPYARPLAALGPWFCQLWAETLGKARDLVGATVHRGVTPIAANGPSDQHAQLQLWVEGPDDKTIVFIRVEDHGTDLLVPTSYEDLETVAYLGGIGLGALVNMEQQATELALVKAKRPSSTIVCPRVHGFTMGQLVYLLETEAVILADLLSVDPFDQPGLEEGKQLTYGLAGRTGAEARRAEMQRWVAKKDGRYVL